VRPDLRMFDPGWRTQHRGWPNNVPPEDRGTRDSGNDPEGVVSRSVTWAVATKQQNVAGSHFDVRLLFPGGVVPGATLRRRVGFGLYCWLATTPRMFMQRGSRGYSYGPKSLLLLGRLVNVTRGVGGCDAACHDQLRNTITVHIRSRHVDNVTCAELGQFRGLLGYPAHHRTPAYYHLKLAEVRAQSLNDFACLASLITEKFRTLKCSKLCFQSI